MNIPTCAPWPNYSEAEGKLAQEVLLSNKVNYWTGVRGREFERQFAKTMDSAHAIALANGTLALELAFIALGIGEGDEVIVTPRSFMASASAIEICGATPVFADVDLVNQNITASTIEAVITEKSKAVVCVHLAGWPCEMQEIKALADQKGLFIIEDCAQAHGAKYHGKSVGSWGDVAAWSFCQDKIMTTGGEGGMVTTNDTALYEKMWSFKDHGKNRQKMESPAKNRRFKYVHDSFGSNYRLTEIQSAIGQFQLEHLDDWRSQRTHNALHYREALAASDLVRNTVPPSHILHAHYKHYFFLNLDLISKEWGRDRIVEEANDRGGSLFSGSCPEIYKEKAFVDRYGEIGSLENAAKLGSESLMVNCHPGISEEYLQFNCSVIMQVLNEAMQ